MSSTTGSKRKFSSTATTPHVTPGAEPNRNNNGKPRATEAQQQDDDMTSDSPGNGLFTQQQEQEHQQVLYSSDDRKPPVVPADGLALDRVNDILDFEIEHIFHDRSTRREHYECLTFFWSIHPANKLGYGRRYVLLFLAELLVVVCGRPPHDGDEDDGVPKRFDSLYTLDRKRWEDLEEDLIKVRVLLLRKDALINYVHEKDTPADASEIDLGRSQNPLFNKKFDMILQLIQINKAIAPIRQQLEDQIMTEDHGNLSKSVDQSQIDEIVEHLKKVENERVQQAVRSLVVKMAPDNSPTNSRNPVLQKYALIDDDKLAATLRSSPFDLVYFQQKFESLLHRMTYEVYRKDQSVLMKLRYTIESGNPMLEVLKTPRKSRRHEITKTYEQSHENKENNHDANESQASSAIGEVTSPPFPSDSPNKGERNAASSPQSAVKVPHGRPCLEIVEELETDDREEYYDRVRLPNPAKRVKVNAIHSIAPPDPGTFNEFGKVTKRRPWTFDEKNCVKLGVKKFGIGRWTQIKKEYAEILRNRTGVQIKDCWRTMNKSGEMDIPPTELPLGIIETSDIVAEGQVASV